MNRRDFFATILSGSALGALFFLKCDWKTRKEASYAAQFLEKYGNILRNIQNQELPKLIHATIRAAEIYKKGGQVLAQFNSRAPFINSNLLTSSTETPNYFSLIDQSIDTSAVNQLQKGDYLITSDVTDLTRQAKRRGVFVLGLAVPSLPNKYTPANRIVMQPDWLTIEETANVVLYTQVPYTDGLLHYPSYPMMPLCPASTISLLCYYWMLTAEMSYHIQQKKTYPFISKAREYLETIINRVYELNKQVKNIIKIASQMAQNIQKGGAFYVYDQKFTLVNEVYHRASSILMIRQLVVDDLKPNDVVILGAEKTGHAEDIELARAIRAKGAFLVAITPENIHPQSGENSLRKIANAVINNLSNEETGIIRIQEESPAICPAGGLMNIVILWTVIAEFIDQMIKIGLVPYVKMGDYLIGGEPYNAAIMPFFNERGF
ncbi:hypothetical protein JW964_23475 [candidate division KSB1 bacterium]|nr:hypothetical protein [candidate division KSB1 bacterium]